MPIAKKLPSGNYRALVYLGKDEDGKRQYKSFTSPDKWEAEEMANQYRKKQKDASPLDLTIGEAVSLT